MIRLNQKGVRIIEGHARIFLRKILGGFSENYMELRSPCGAAVGQIAYYYDGIYIPAMKEECWQKWEVILFGLEMSTIH